MRYRAHVLHSLLLGFVQRRSHVVLQNSLPPKEEFVLMVRMTAFQRRVYEVFMNEVVRTKAVPNPLKAFAVCCKIWNHPDVLYNFLKKREADLDLEEAGAAAADTAYDPDATVGRSATGIKSTAAAKKREPKDVTKSKTVATAAASKCTSSAISDEMTKPKEIDHGGTQIEAAKCEQIGSEPKTVKEQHPPTQHVRTYHIDSKHDSNQTNLQQQQQHQQQNQSHHHPHNPYFQQPYSSDYYGQYNNYDNQQHNSYYNNSYNKNNPNASSSTSSTYYGQGYNQEQHPSSYQQQQHKHSQDSYWQHQQQSNPNYYTGDYNHQHHHQPQHQQKEQHAYTDSSHYGPGAYVGQYPYGQYDQPSHQPNQYSNAAYVTSSSTPSTSSHSQADGWTAPAATETAIEKGDDESLLMSKLKTESKFIDMDTNEIKIENPLSMNLDIAKIENKTVTAALKIESRNGTKAELVQQINDPTLKNTDDSNASRIAGCENVAATEEPSVTQTDDKDAIVPVSVTTSITTTPTVPTPSTAAKPAKGDDGIPYDWAVDLMKNYVPDLISNSPKMEIFFCILEESLRLRDRMLVFSQSLLTLSLIEKFLQANMVAETGQRWMRNVNYYRECSSTFNACLTLIFSILFYI